jgi:hypothetical protein
MSVLVRIICSILCTVVYFVPSSRKLEIKCCIQIIFLYNI